MSSRATARLAILICASSATAFGQLRDAAPLTTFVGGSSQCPTPLDVALEAIRLTPPNQHGIYSSGVRVQLDDLGASYRVTISAHDLVVSKTYADPARECARRTTFAAVLILMTLMPPQLARESDPNAAGEGTESARDAPPVPPPLATASKEAPSRSKPVANQPSVLHQPAAPEGVDQLRKHRETWFRSSAGATGTWAPPVGGSMSIAAWGLAWQLSIGKHALSPYMALAYATSSAFAISGISGHVQRWPAALGLEGRHTLRWIDVAASLGALAIFEQIRGDELVVSQPHSGFEWGARMSVSAAWLTGTISPFLSMSVDWVPSPQTLRIAPRGTIGHTPALQLWNSVGMRIDL